MPRGEGALLGLSAGLKSIVRHTILFRGLGKRVKCAGPILTIYTLRKVLPFGARDDCTRDENFCSADFVNRD